MKGLWASLCSYLNINSHYDGLKIVILSICFFLTLGSYTLVKELKDSIFVLMVGPKYLPEAKMLSYLIMIPLVLFYEWLSSKMKRHMLLVFYALLYGIGGLLSAYTLRDPVIGLSNMVASGDRIFGWVFYLFLEGFSPFVVSVLWALMNSVSKPEEIKNRYVLVTATSKFGGVLSAGLAWLFMSRNFVFAKNISDVDAHVYLLVAASTILLVVPILLCYLFYAVPDSYLQGYSDIKEHHAASQVVSQDSESGFKLLFRYPYVLGIFGMIFFWEVINVVLNFMRLSVGLKDMESMAGFGAFLFKNAMLTHLVGFFITIFGTASLIKILGERLSLLAIPLLIGGAVLFFFIMPNSETVIFTYVFVRAINYSFAYPLREGLYIPTSTSIKFKAKSWIDSFGSKFSKALGSGYNKLLFAIPAALVGTVQIAFFVAILFLWTILAYFMGKRWQEAVKEGKIIGK